MIGGRTRVGLAMLILLAAGCGRDLGNVSGTVKFKGQPLPAGTITFYDRDKGATSSEIKSDGTYSVSKVATGPVKISLAVPMSIPFASPMGGGTVAPPIPRVPNIPARYMDAEKSGLGFEVVKGDQTHDFNLEP
jgi:hypothetical protein